MEVAEEAEAVYMLDTPTVGKHAFSAMAGDFDSISRQRLRRAPDEMHAMQQQRV